jgi:hypothetical protein
MEFQSLSPHLSVAIFEVICSLQEPRSSFLQDLFPRQALGKDLQATANSISLNNCPISHRVAQECEA